MKISKIICAIRGHRPFTHTDERIADQKALKSFREELSRTQSELAELRKTIHDELNKTAQPPYTAASTAGMSIMSNSLGINGTIGTVWSTLNATSQGLSSHLSGLSSGTFSLKSGVSTDNSDFVATYHICSRCMSLYADTEFKESICDARKVPALKEFIEWKAEMAREEKIRENNESVRDLYRDYMVMMKLSSGENNSD